ncbi:MAG: hypothetical protein RL662_1404 [Bacteroidota bacterium]|jgi:cell division transport system permease protein
MSTNSKAKTSSFFSAEVTTTISISLVLLLLGLTILVGTMGREISSFIKENMSIIMELTDADSANKNSIEKLEKQLKASPYIKSVTFISKEDIKKELIEELGGDPQEILGYTPVSNYFELNLKAEYANTDSIKKVEASLRDKRVIKSFVYSEETLDIVNSNLNKMTLILGVLALTLIIISFTLLQNTIKLNIYSKRFLINTMRLVGATDQFIRKPFILKSMASGLIAVVFANIGITALVYTLSKEFPEINLIINYYDLVILYVIVLVLGILLTYFATRFAVNRYLKMETNNLYYI